MQYNSFIQGVAHFRLPKEINNEIADLPKILFSAFEIKKGEDVSLCRKYGFLRMYPAPADSAPDVACMAEWTPFGHAIATKFGAPRMLRQRVHTPQHRFSELLDAIPAHIRDGLLSDPPYIESTPGAFFQAVGVCDQLRGEWFLTHYGRRALAGYRIAKVTGDENGVFLHEFFTPPVRKYMRRVLHAGQGGLPVLGDNGLPQHKDARELRPFNDENAAVLLSKEVPDTSRPKMRMVWHHYIAPDMIPFVEACCEEPPRPRSAVEVYNLIPAKDQFGFMRQYASGDAQRRGIFMRLGWITKRDRGEYAFSKTGAIHAEGFRAADRQAAEDARLMHEIELNERRAAYVPIEPTLDDLTMDFDLGATDDADDFNIL